MHTLCLQIKDIRYDTEELSIEEVEDILVNDHYVDYVKDYDDAEDSIIEFLKLFEKNGCVIDLVAHTFEVKDKEDFCKFLLREVDSFYDEDCNLITWEEKAKFVHASLSGLYFSNPTVCDGCGYGSLFEALSYDLFGFHNSTKEYNPAVYKLVGVYDCHN